MSNYRRDFNTMDINYLLLNILFILLPVFFYHLILTLKLVQGKKEKHRLFLLGLFSSLSALLCMHYRIELNEGFFYDLRVIPVLIAILYGGYRVGISVTAITLLFRFFIGGEGFLAAVIVLSFALLLAAPFSKAFLQTSWKKRLFIPIAISTLAQTGLVFSYTYHFEEAFVLTPVERISIVFINLFGMALVIYVIELLRKVNSLQEELVETEKLKAVSELGASISHEVKNPLTVSKGLIQMLQSADLPPARQQEYLALADQEIERASTVISDYLTFARPAEDKVEDFSVDKEIECIVKLVTPLAHLNGVQIETDVCSNSFINGNRSKFHQCLVNLIKNGIEASPNKTTLEVKTVCREGSCYVWIKDEGGGMTEQEISQLGTPYFSNKEKGTGLGMTVVYHIVKAMNGRISVQSEKGKGTTFTLTFPTVSNNHLPV